MRLLFILLGTALLSCSKERNFHLRARNAVTGAPYAGLNYYVVEEREGNNGTDYTTVATGTLDGNGEKMVSVKVRKNRSYVIRLDPPPNWCYMNEVSYSYTIQGDQNPTFDFTFAECAYLKQHIENVNCEGGTDVFNVRDKYSYTEWTGWSIDLSGCYSNTNGDYSAVPAGKRYFNWRVSRPSGITEGIDSVELTPGEYETIIINY